MRDLMSAKFGVGPAGSKPNTLLKLGLEYRTLWTAELPQHESDFDVVGELQEPLLALARRGLGIHRRSDVGHGRRNPDRTMRPMPPWTERHTDGVRLAQNTVSPRSRNCARTRSTRSPRRRLGVLQRVRQAEGLPLALAHLMERQDLHPLHRATGAENLQRRGVVRDRGDVVDGVGQPGHQHVPDPDGRCRARPAGGRRPGWAPTLAR